MGGVVALLVFFGLGWGGFGLLWMGVGGMGGDNMGERVRVDGFPDEGWWLGLMI